MPAETSEVTRRIGPNTAYNLFGRLTILAISFVFTPYLIVKLGFELYGLWAVLSALTAYVGLIDLGLTGTFVKFIAEYQTKAEPTNVSRVVTIALFWYLVLGLLLFPLLVVSTPLLLSLIDLPQASKDLAVVLLPALFVLYVVTNALGAWRAVVEALQEMKLTNLISSASYALYAACGFILIEAGHGLYGLFAATAILVCLRSALFWVAAKRLYPDVRLEFQGITLPFLKRILGFGAQTQLNYLTAVINQQTDRIFIGKFVGAAAVTPYEIGNRLAILVYEVPALAVSAVLPVAAAMDARGRHEQLNDLYLRGTRYLGLASIGLGGFVVLNADFVIRAWIGRPVPLGSFALVVLTTGYVVNSVTGFGTTIARAIGRPDMETRYTVLSALLNVSLTLVLLTFLGFYGIVIGTTLGATLGSLYFLRIFHRNRGLELRRVFQPWLGKAIVASALASVPVVSLGAGGQVLDTRSTAIAFVVAGGVLYTALYLVLLRLFGAIDAGEVRGLRHLATLAWFGSSPRRGP